MRSINFKKKVKCFLILVLFFSFVISVKAQITLPTYQAVNHQKRVINSLICNALDFDGINDYVDCGINASLNIKSSMTIELWIKPNQNMGNSKYDRLVHRNWPTGYFFGGKNGAVNALAVVLSGDLNAAVTPNNTVVVGVWQHVAFVFDDPANTIKIYKDGVVISTSTWTGSILGDPNSTLTLSQSAETFNGALDDVRIWNVARTQTEIQSNMNKELVGTETGLVSYYTFNQGIAAGDNSSITTITDKTSNANHATLSNFAKTGATSNLIVGKVVGDPVLLIPKGTYTAITTSGTFPLNTSLGGGNITFIGGDTFSSNSAWGPQQLFDNNRSNYDWCSNGSSQFGQFVFPKAVTISKIFIVPRSQGDQFPTSVTLKVDGVTVGTYTSISISQTSGLGINYTGTGYYIQPNISGTTWKLEFPATTYIGELEFWGN